MAYQRSTTAADACAAADASADGDHRDGKLTRRATVKDAWDT